MLKLFPALTIYNRQLPYHKQHFSKYPTLHIFRFYYKNTVLRQNYMVNLRTTVSGWQCDIVNNHIFIFWQMHVKYCSNKSFAYFAFESGKVEQTQKWVFFEYSPLGCFVVIYNFFSLWGRVCVGIWQLPLEGGWFAMLSNSS